MIAVARWRRKQRLKPMPLWLASDPLLLASRSSARRTLLEAAGIPIESQPADLDERALEASVASESPAQIAGFLAWQKAASVARLRPGRLVLGADQMLALDSARFSKPLDRAAARAQLQKLRGHVHELHSAVTLVKDDTVLFDFVDTVWLTMRSFSDEFLEAYLDKVGAAAATSVGAYQIEGPGIQLFERVEGDYFTVLGLPLLQTLDFLRRQGLLSS
jgi:septum formation protein